MKAEGNDDEANKSNEIDKEGGDYDSMKEGSDNKPDASDQGYKEDNDDIAEEDEDDEASYLFLDEAQDRRWYQRIRR